MAKPKNSDLDDRVGTLEKHVFALSKRLAEIEYGEPVVRAALEDFKHTSAEKRDELANAIQPFRALVEWHLGFQELKEKVTTWPT